MRLLLPAGVETTYRSLGNLLFALLSDPAQLAAIRADRSLLPQAIEEGVRWEPPLLTITRVATRDTELGGVPIPAGSTVMPMLGAANRQEDRYPDPDTFDIFRQARGHLGWGHGVHVCLGMHLARLEMRTAINLLLDRLPNLRLDPDGDDPHIRGQVSGRRLRCRCCSIPGSTFPQAVGRPRALPVANRLVSSKALRRGAVWGWPSRVPAL